MMMMKCFPVTPLLADSRLSEDAVRKDSDHAGSHSLDRTADGVGHEQTRTILVAVLVRMGKMAELVEGRR